MPRRTSRSLRRFHRAMVGDWDRRLEERIYDEARKAQETLVVRRLEQDAAIRKAADEGGGRPLRSSRLASRSSSTDDR